jgi:SpoVK/Ycf46/Vps4 family AAA+-type ATPase
VQLIQNGIVKKLPP